MNKLWCLFTLFFILSVKYGYAQVIPRTNWSLKYVDSQETSCGNWAAVNSFDGNTSTFWHTQWCTSNPPPPHEIQINLGGLYNISGFQYLPRQDGSPNGRIGQYEFYISTDGVNWGTPVATGVFANDGTQKTVSFTSVSGQYVRLRALSEVNGNPWTSMAELNVLGVPLTNQPPDGVINTPYSDITIAVGDKINFTGTGTDPDNNLPLSYNWSFGAGSGIPNSTAQNPGIVQFNNPGTFTVTFTVTDAKGLSDPTPATRTITVSSSVIPRTNWSLKYVDSQETSCGNWAAVNSFDGNTSTFWHTQWCTSNPPPPHEIQINLGGLYNISGFQYLPRQDGSPNGRIGQYEFYISTDGVNWGTPVATGVFANDGTQKTVSFTSVSGQYVRLRALSEVNGNPWTSMAELNVIGSSSNSIANISIPRVNWSLKYVDSQELVGEYDAAVNSFDGNADTLWHTEWFASSPPPPHEIQINLGGLYNISGFQYLPRQDGSPNGRIGQYEFYISTDGVNWGTPVATGVFANDGTQKTVSFTSVSGQYVRLRALSEVNGNPWTSMAELNVLAPCITPLVKIIQPQNNLLQTSSTSVSVNASACGLNSGWGVRFILDGGPTNGGAQFDDYTSPFGVIFTNLAKSEHFIDAFIIDNSGNLVSGNGTHDRVKVGIGDYYVAVGDSITDGFRDDITSDGISQDGRNIGGYEPILNNLLTNRKGYPQTVVNKGIGGTTSSNGASSIASVLASNPDAQYFLIEYGTNDASIPVPSGLGLHPGDPGYPGTFKANMQQIITSIKNAGKLPYLAKVPYSTGQYSGRNSLYQTYNQVIDELVSENNISVVPPDFYTYFQNNQTQLSSDGLHPNGAGYQGMANLWFNALP